MIKIRIASVITALVCLSFCLGWSPAGNHTSADVPSLVPPELGEQLENAGSEEDVAEEEAADPSLPVFTYLNPCTAMNSILTERERSLCLDAALRLMAGVRVIDLSEIPPTAARRVFRSLRESPYRLFAEKITLSPDAKEIRISYESTYDDHDQALGTYQNQLIAFLNSQVTGQMTDIEKVLAIYRAAVEAAAEIRADSSLTSGLCVSLLSQAGFRARCIDGTLHDVRHTWIALQFDGHWYQCDPANDAADGVCGLSHFGMTDPEASVTGLIPDRELSFACDNSRFFPLHQISSFSFGEDHTLLCHTYYDDRPVTISSKDL